MPVAPTLQIDRSIRRALRSFNRDRLRWLDEASVIGPLVALKLGPATAWVVSDADIARTILVTEADRWVRPPSALTPIRVAIGENLFTQADESWATLQPTLSPGFRKRTLAARLENLPELIRKQVASVKRGDLVDLEALTNRIALAVAANVLFDQELEPERADELAEHQQAIASWVGQRIGQARSVIPIALGPSARELRTHRSALDAYADQIIRGARQTPPSADSVLAALLSARPRGAALGSEALRAHVLGLLFAGNETTAAALAWALVEGAQQPTQWGSIRNDPLLVPDFISETLRFHPAVWSIARRSTARHARLTTNDTTATVKRNEVVTIYIRGINRNPLVWHDPASFRPERHRTLTSEQQRSLLPFGLGPRSCIGQHLATAELHAALSVLASLGDVQLRATPTENPRFALRFHGGLSGSFGMNAPVPQ